MRAGWPGQCAATTTTTTPCTRRWTRSSLMRPGDADGCSMADLEELGPPPAFGAIVRAGDAVGRLHLSTDTTVPDYVVHIAARVEKAVLAAQEAIDYAVELHEEGALQPVELVPSADAASETPRRDAPRVWACHAELEEALEVFVAASPQVQLSLERAEGYEAALRGAKQAL